jgi:hypothetical protein
MQTWAAELDFEPVLIAPFCTNLDMRRELYNSGIECVTIGVNSSLNLGRILIGVKEFSCKCCRGEGFLVPTRYRLIGYSHAVLVGIDIDSACKQMASAAEV